MQWTRKQRGTQFRFSVVLQLPYTLISEHLAMWCHQYVKVLLLLFVYSFEFSCQDREQSACYLTCYPSILLALFSDLVLSSSLFVQVWLSAVQNTWPWTGKHPGGIECQKWYKQQQITGLASLKCYEYLQIKNQVYLHCFNALMDLVPINKAVLLKKKVQQHVKKGNSKCGLPYVKMHRN